MRISVVTVAYNRADTIAETIASVAGQDWPDFEHIIVDGASTDGTANVARAMQHPRMRVISEPDEGLYDAMNKGLREAGGDYVGFLNADDFFASRHALRQVAEAALASGADCILGDTAFVDRHGRPKGRIYSARGFARWWPTIGLMPPHPSFYARTGRLRDAGGFDTRYRIAADFDLIARLFLAGGASWARAPFILACFRVGGVSTAGAGAKLTIGREMADSLRRLGRRLPAARVMLRYPFKLAQLIAGRIGRGRVPRPDWRRPA